MIGRLIKVLLLIVIALFIIHHIYVIIVPWAFEGIEKEPFLHLCVTLLFTIFAVLFLTGVLQAISNLIKYIKYGN